MRIGRRLHNGQEKAREKEEHSPVDHLRLRGPRGRSGAGRLPDGGGVAARYTGARHGHRAARRRIRGGLLLRTVALQ